MEPGPTFPSRPGSTSEPGRPGEGGGSHSFRCHNRQSLCYNLRLKVRGLPADLSSSSSSSDVIASGRFEYSEYIFKKAKLSRG